MTQKPTYEELERKVREFQETSIEWERAKKLLRKSGELYRNVYDTAPLAFVVWDLDTCVTDWNRKAEKVFGWSKKEALGQPFFDFLIPQKDLPYVKTIVDKLVKGKLPSYSVNDNLTKSGRVITCEWNNSPLHDDERNIVGVISLALDITERKRAEEALRESEQSFRALADNANDGIVIITAEGGHAYANNRASEIFGYSISELLKIKFDKLFEPEELKAIHQRFERRIMGKELPGRSHETTLVRKDGNTVEVWATGARTTWQGQPAVISIVRDVTHRKQAEQALREERDNAQKYLDIAAVIIIAIDAEGKVKLINKKGCEVLGYKEEEIVGKNWFDNFLPEKQRAAVKTVADQLLAGEIEPAEYYENPILTKSGQERLIAWDNTTLRDEAGNIVGHLSSGTDITKRKQAEEELQAAHDKLESKVQLRTSELEKANALLLTRHGKLRSLASQLSLAEEKERRRVATEVHDYIGQNLAFSKIKLNELQASISPESSQSIAEVIELIDKAIGDIRHLVNELGSPVLYELGLAPAVESLARQFRENLLNVTFEDDKKPKPISDDVKIFVFQAIRELLANVAKHAKAANCTVSLKAEGAKLRLDIVDDGIGFDVEKIEAVGSKERGFGFFSIRERLEPLGGSLEINSKPDEWTRITLFTPLKK